MKRPPALANALLTRLGSIDDALVGDLYQEWSTGRSRLWFWRQTSGAIVWGAVRDIRRLPLQTCAAILTGWAAVALVFLRGDQIAYAIARLGWNWERQTAADVWWPYWISAAVVSYGGFGLSAWIVARVYRRHAAMLIAYVAATFAFLLSAGIAMQVLTSRGEPVLVVHPLFYAISATLAYQAHSGILLIPLTMVLCGALGRRSRPQPPTSNLQHPTSARAAR